MAFFNLTDIKIKSPKRNFRAQLPSNFGTSVLRYPLDIGSLDKGHYMVIHINEQIKTRFSNTPNTDPNSKPTILRNQENNGTATGLTTIGPNIVGGLGQDIANSDPVKQLTEVAGQVAGIAGSKVDSLTNIVLTEQEMRNILETTTLWQTLEIEELSDKNKMPITHYKSESRK